MIVLQVSLETWFSFLKREKLCLLQLCLIFIGLELCQYSKYSIFLLVWWFLAKNLSNFGCCMWKLHDPHDVNNYITPDLITRNHAKSRGNKGGSCDNWHVEYWHKVWELYAGRLQGSRFAPWVHCVQPKTHHSAQTGNLFWNIFRIASTHFHYLWS